MKIIETRATAVRLAECDESLTLEDLDNPSAVGPRIVYRDIQLQRRRDIAGRPCLAAYDRATDTLYVRYQP